MGQWNDLEAYTNAVRFARKRHNETYENLNAKRLARDQAEQEYQNAMQKHQESQVEVEKHERELTQQALQRLGEKP